MNTSFPFSMESKFSYLSNKPLNKGIGIMKPKIGCIIIIASVSFFAAGCNGNNSTSENKKKTDTVFVQPNNREREGESMDGSHGGAGNKGDDSMHGRMGRGAHGLDSMHRGRHN